MTRHLLACTLCCAYAAQGPGSWVLDAAEHTRCNLRVSYPFVACFHSTTFGLDKVVWSPGASGGKNPISSTARVMHRTMHALVHPSPDPSQIPIISNFYGLRCQVVFFTRRVPLWIASRFPRCTHRCAMKCSTKNESSICVGGVAIVEAVSSQLVWPNKTTKPQHALTVRAGYRGYCSTGVRAASRGVLLGC